jgi:hypothetical protein
MGATVPPLTRAVGSADQHALAGHGADADDAAAAHHALLAVVVVHAQAGQRAELQEVAAAVEQPRHAFARQQLAAASKLAALALAFATTCACRPALRPAFAHALRVGGERGRPADQLEVSCGMRGRHAFSTSGVTARWKPSKGRDCRFRSQREDLAAQRGTAVDLQRHAGDEGRRRRQQEDDGRADLGLLPMRRNGTWAFSRGIRVFIAPP